MKYYSRCQLTFLCLPRLSPRAPSFLSPLRQNPHKNLILYMLLKTSMKYSIKWWLFHLLASGIINMPKSYLLTSFFCLVNLSLFLVFNLSNAYHRLSFFEDSLSVTLTPSVLLRLLILNAIIHLSFFVSRLYLNVSTIPPIFANN